MSPPTASVVQAARPRILDRRARLQAAAGSISAEYLDDLLAEVDAALQRIDNGTYGICEYCHDTIEADRLEVDPLARFCVDHLGEKELRAHEQDIELASRIQSRLLPSNDLPVEGWETHYEYQPAGPVGGDYCEAATECGQSLFFAVGDISGKGVAASLLMTHLSAILRSLMPLQLPLAELVARANRLFCESTLAAHYATLVCGRAGRDEVELCNAGHCPPFHLRRDGAQRLDGAGLPLGLFSNVQYPVTHVRLAAGESLVLYSDGVTEALDPEGNEFGEERLAHSLRTCYGTSAEQLARSVLADAISFRAGCRAADDVTLMVVRRRP